MAKTSKSKKTTSPAIKSWGDITKLKKSIDIKFEDEVIFTMVEISEKKIFEFLELLQSKQDENKDEINKDNIKQSIEENNVIDSVEFIAFALKNTIQGIDFGEMSDEEIVEKMNDMSMDITMQINDALEELIVKKITFMTESLQKFMSAFEKNDNNVIN